MAFSLSPEQQQLVSEVRATARERFAPLAGAEGGGVNRPLLRALGEQGLLARLFPVSGNVSAMELCLLREALASECTDAETALALQGLGAYPIVQSGSPKFVDEWIRPVAAGEAVAAFALTEPGAGSDAGALSLAAEMDGDGYRLTGTKKWISNAPEADVYTVFARTTPDTRARGVTAFVVPGDAHGLSGSHIELNVPHAIGTLEFDGVAVPASSVLGEVDGGFRVAMRTLDLFRPSVGAFAVGMAQAALEVSLAHAAERETFGKPLRAHQAVSQALADMATRTQAARLLVYAAASSYDSGAKTITMQSAMAKLFATEQAQLVIDAAIQIHGAAALEKGHLLEGLYRDVRATRIYEGASEIQREVITRELYREP
jgi:acyl-CoA dehydrogenase